jgi:fructose-bisphosphate aldolase class II
MTKPIPGNVLFNNLKDRSCIVMAANPRVVSGVATGIMRAAKDLDSAIIFEMAKSEVNLAGGYTGLTPSTFSKRIHEVAEDVGHDIWVLHADHITIKKGTTEEIEDTKQLIAEQVQAGYTSFAIDPSHLYNFEGGNLREELGKNIDVTTELAKFIESKMAGKPFGLEVEVGEIGRTDEHGRVLTTPEEAVTFIQALKENDVHPHVLAIANGSAHGNIFDEAGNPIEQVSIDIPQTKSVAKALRDNNLDVRIAQHGITGTPRELINTQFPKGDIIKGNVATFYQNIVYDTMKVFQPELYEKAHSWVIDTYKEKAPGKKNIEIFGKFAKFGIKQFFDEIYGLDEDTMHAIESISYAETLSFLRAFNSKGTADVVRKAL